MGYTNTYREDISRASYLQYITHIQRGYKQLYITELTQIHIARMYLQTQLGKLCIYLYVDCMVGQFHRDKILVLFILEIPETLIALTENFSKFIGGRDGLHIVIT